MFGGAPIPAIFVSYPNPKLKRFQKEYTSRVEDGRGSVKPRFPSPLIKPDMRSYRIRLSD